MLSMWITLIVFDLAQVTTPRALIAVIALPQPTSLFIAQNPDSSVSNDALSLGITPPFL